MVRLAAVLRLQGRSVQCRPSKAHAHMPQSADDHQSAELRGRPSSRKRMSSGLPERPSRVVGSDRAHRYDRSHRSRDVNSAPLVDDGFSDWSSWTECTGVPCKTGRQQRIRACLKSSIIDDKKSICNGEQIQERECVVPCSSKSPPLHAPVRPLSNGNHRFRNASNASLLPDRLQVCTPTGRTGRPAERPTARRYARGSACKSHAWTISSRVDRAKAISARVSQRR